MSFYCLTDSDQKNWLDDPELFLYAKGPDDVHLWRCKKPASSSSSSSLVVPMKSDDFDYVSNVKNHEELIGYLFNWEETDYNRLIKYIYEKRLLVNSQGFVIAELLHKADKDANKTIDDANEEDVPAIYIRSLDVLRLKPYIPDLTEPPIPLRMVKYLGDVNGEAAMMEEDSKVIKLTARVDNLEAEIISLKSKNNTLESNVSKLTARVANLEAENTRLESKNNTLDTNITKLTADMVSQMNALATLQKEVDGKLDNPNYKEDWRNDLTNRAWVGIENLSRVTGSYDSIVITKGTYPLDDNSTNVRATYWNIMTLEGFTAPNKFQAVSLEDLTPNKEKARFTWSWWNLNSEGKTYLLRRL